MSTAPFCCRSMLITCGLDARQYGRALEIGADIGTLDLEDSVPAERREAARRMVLPFLAAEPARPGFTRAVRPNALRTPDGLRDLLAILDSGAHVDALMLPKVESAEDVRIVEEVLGERLAAVVFLVLIETARGLAAVEEIAAASPRVQALVFGAADFSADLGGTMDWEHLVYARSRIVAAAARARTLAMDTPFFDIADGEGLRREIERVRAMGYAGKVAVHPRQVPAINAGFTPEPAALAEARAVLAAIDDSQGRIAVVDGRMVGPPAVIAARRLLALAARVPGRQAALPSPGAAAPPAPPPPGVRQAR
jgi:citrate lyase beta subunit